VSAAHQDDITAYLKAKLEDRNPKCGNCKHWGTTGAVDRAAVGVCSRNSLHQLANTSTVQPALFEVICVYTTDLTLCSAWEKREQ
jgi:hypothetical protein